MMRSAGRPARPCHIGANGIIWEDLDGKENRGQVSMITQVSAHNFRSLADVTVDLGALTVLVGRNGAGKSTFVDVLAFISEALQFGLDAAITKRHGIKALARWTPGRPPDIELRVSLRLPDLSGDYGFVIASKRGTDYQVKREWCRVKTDHPRGPKDGFEIVNGKWSKLPDGVTGIIIGPSEEPVPHTLLALGSIVRYGSPALTRMYGVLTHSSSYAIFPNSLREPQKPSSEYPLSEHGENLASVLRAMCRRRDDTKADLCAALSRVVEGISDIRVRQVGGYLVTELEHARPGDRSPWFELAQESDGTLRMLGLLVALQQTPPRGFIAIEEPELTIHPGAVGMLSDLIMEAATRSQILVTTQSPDFIARVPAESLRVVERVEGVTKIGVVSEAQRETINEELFTAGDLLRIEGLRRDEPEMAGVADD